MVAISTKHGLLRLPTSFQDAPTDARRKEEEKKIWQCSVLFT
jgi:hypothetical protein